MGKIKRSKLIHGDFSGDSNMKRILLLIVVFALILTIALAGTEEALSSITGTNNSIKDYSTAYSYSIVHRDGSTVQINLIRFNKPVCADFDGQSGCVGGFTIPTSNYARKQDPEHPVDTTETVNLIFSSGKIPKVNEESLMHELYHVVDLHYHSRSVCEANWRYSECMEAQAYDYTYLLKQARKLKVKLI